MNEVSDRLSLLYQQKMGDSILNLITMVYKPHRIPSTANFLTQMQY